MKEHAEAELLSALSRYFEQHVNDDSKRMFIWKLEAIWCTGINAIFVGLIHGRTLKPSAARDIFHLLVRREPELGRRLVEECFSTRRNLDNCSVLVPEAGVVLFSEFPLNYGAALVEEFAEDATLGRAISLRCANDVAASKGWLSRLPPEATARYWEWLEAQFPGDPYDDGNSFHASMVTTSHQMYDFRQMVFQSLVGRGTRQACVAMARLAGRRRADFWLGDVLARMRASARRSTWTRPSPASLMRAFADADQRLIRTAGDLQAALIESIGRFDAALHGETPSLELWNTVSDGRTKVWDPKDEENLSNCLKRHFERDLERRGVIASREVEICPRLGDDPAQLVDVLVKVAPIAEDGNAAAPVTVVVEVKCSWNDGVLVDMGRQLFSRYLENDALDFGIYVVGYFTCSGWNRPRDPRRSRGASTMGIKEMRSRLLVQASELTSSEKRIEALVIDARI